MLKAYKYRLYPTAEQADIIERTFGCCRLVYNLALETKIIAYKQHGVSLSAIDLCYQLKGLKEEHPFLKEVDSQALQASIKKLDEAFKHFFRRGGFPKFKAKGSNESFQCPANTRKVDFDRGILTIPKIANIPIRISRRFKGKIKTVTISKNSAGQYHASILVDNEKPYPKKPEIKKDRTVGIDLGLKDLIVTSEGIRVKNPKHLKEAEQRLKVQQRRLSRKQKGSNNREKQRKRLAKANLRLTNKREDILHKVSTMLVRDSQADTLVVESLSSSSLMKNHKLAAAIGDAGWGKLVGFLEYKCHEHGKNLVKAARTYPSTQLCSNCGHRNRGLTLKDREWECPSCGTHHDRDENAAVNLENVIDELSGAGSSDGPVESSPLGGAKKQEYVVSNSI